MLTTFAMTRGTLAADWSETLEAGGNLAYNTNPLLQPRGNLSDQSAQLTADGTTIAQTERTQFTVTPRFSIVRYAHQIGYDEDTGSIDLSYVEKSERGQWTLSGEALSDTTVTSELGTSGITGINRRRYVETASVGYQYAVTERLTWQVQGTWQDTRYSEALQYGLTNYQYASAVFGPNWNFTERVQGSLILETDEISPQAGQTQKDYSASLQVKRSFSEQYAWRISAGATRVEAGNSGGGTSSVFEIGATRQGELVQWDASFKQAVLPIGLGLLAREDIAALSVTANISEHTTFGVSINSTRSDPVAISVYFLPGIAVPYQIFSGANFEQATASWNCHFTEHWTVLLAYTQSRARNYSIPFWANGNQARLGVLWQSGRL